MHKCKKGKVTISGNIIPVFAYEQAKAQQYADNHVFDDKDTTTGFKWYKNNCTNFVSQCLLAGGLYSGLKWYGNTLFQSDSWSKSNSLKEYMKNDLSATLLGRWSYTAGNNSNGVYHYSYMIKNSANINGTGDEVIFYDWEGDGTIDHSSIVVGTNYAFQGKNGQIAAFDYNRGYGDLIDQHTNARRHQIWNLYEFNERHKTTNIYAYRLK